MILNSTVWELFSWLWLGTTIWLLKAWFVGDLNLMYWMPRLTRNSFMLNYKLIMYLRLPIDLISVLASWFIWKDNGKWTGFSTLPLIFVSVYYFLTVLLFYLFNVWYRIRISFYLSIAIAIFSIGISIYYFIFQITPGILSIVVALWDVYYLYWSYSLFSNNVSTKGKVQTGGKTQYIVSSDPNAIPTEEAYARAGRKLFFNPNQKYGSLPVVIGRGNDAVNVSSATFSTNNNNNNMMQSRQQQQQYSNGVVFDDDE